LERDLAFKEQQVEKDVLFINVFQKKNRNKFCLPFEGIGRKKLLLFVDPGFPFRLTPMSFALRVTNLPSG